MKKFYLTFGCAHPLCDNWIEIEAESLERGRKLAFETFDRKWSSIYEQEDWERAVESFPNGKVGNTLR